MSQPAGSSGDGRPATAQDDAVSADPDASYDRAAAAPPLTDTEHAVVSAQLSRPARGRSAVVHRCAFGLPTVVRVDPRLDDGTPFPTVFWLTCPVMNSRLGTVESEGRMTEMTERLSENEELAAAYEDAHHRYVEFRDELGGSLPGAPGAGGMPGYVKCLHTQVAHTLATGDNPIGREVLEEVTPLHCPRPCVDPDEVTV